ncbi:hypothetical protein [Methanosarcina sp. Kolksee]|nr:hypothetical protein [Methanosarcina sp. Kolksee]
MEEKVAYEFQINGNMIPKMTHILLIYLSKLYIDIEFTGFKF